ncbi:MAG: hypothetical protein M3Q56_09815 [Bacteroidota bacterium]|nr:hypothetical protein [Bacteroidota bacterium]
MNKKTFFIGCVFYAVLGLLAHNFIPHHHHNTIEEAITHHHSEHHDHFCGNETSEGHGHHGGHFVHPENLHNGFIIKTVNWKFEPFQVDFIPFGIKINIAFKTAGKSVITSELSTPFLLRAYISAQSQRGPPQRV